MLEYIRRDIVIHFRQNILIYLLVIFILITGIMAGAFTVVQLSSEQKLYVGNYIREFFNSQQSLPVDRGAIFRQGLWQHFWSVFFIWFFGMFFWGAPFILIIIGIRGFFLGFTVGFMVEHYTFGGFLFSLVCILPQSLIYLLAYLAMGIYTLVFCIDSFKNRKTRFTSSQIKQKIGIHTIRILLLFLVILLGITLETLITPLFFPLFTWIF